MNLFIIPSWYPSASNPSYGIFIREQIQMMARERPDWKIGVSTWGQGDHEKLIWVRDHLRNLKKFRSHVNDRSNIAVYEGYKEYYQPALSWTKKFRKGNLSEILKSNELNYQAYKADNGKPDVLMVQACYPGILAGNHLFKKYDVPVYLHIRLGGFMFEHLLKEVGSMRSELLDAIGEAKKVVATSEFHAGELKKWVSDISVLHNPVDLDFFRIENTSEEYAVAIGRLEEEKGFGMLIDAMTKVPNLNLKIVGSGSELDKLSGKVRKLGLNDRIRFEGEADRNKVRELIQKSDFLILPSKYETFGNVLLEAMACGKPVVATKCGGPEEIVTQQTGLLADLSSDDLAQKIMEMSNRKKREVFKSGEIRKHLAEGYSPHIWMNNLEVHLKASL